MKDNFSEVTREEFFAAIGLRNLHPSPEGEWPYTSNFKTQMGHSYGRIEPVLHPVHKRFLVGSTYWLSPDIAPRSPSS